MAAFDDIAERLPAPRDDEPASLRQDIVDELSDHLHCAVNRELHRGNDELKAKQNALDRFGNPARVAYRLWFDAMKEKIMSQRITLAAAVLVAVACLFVAGMAWQMSQQNRETNLAMLEKLSALATQQEQHKSLDWNPVKIKFVIGDENGPPAAGFKVSLSSTGGFGSDNATASQMPRLDETSGDDGAVDLGLVRYGVYQLLVSTPWQEHGNGTITVRPGKSFSKTIVCPAKPEPAELAIEIDWPDDLKQAKLWACGSVSFESVRFGNSDFFWGSYSTVGTHHTLISDTGAMIDCGDSSPYRQNALVSDSNKPVRVPLKTASALNGFARRAFVSKLIILSEPKTTGNGELELPAQPLATYNFKPLASPTSSGGGYGGGGFFGGTSSFGLQPTEPAEASPISAEALAAVAQYPVIEPKANELNHWKIKLPDELVNGVRDRLKAEKTP